MNIILFGLLIAFAFITRTTIIEAIEENKALDEEIRRIENGR